MNATSHVDIYWVQDLCEVGELADLFTMNVTSEYISHSELQLGLAVTPTRWSPDLPQLMKAEIADTIGRSQGVAIQQASTSIFVARLDREPVGMGTVSWHVGGPTIPYATLEDIVVRSNDRHTGIGRSILDWLKREVHQAGCRRIFLESGARNHGAHEFFKKHGFAQCSVVMLHEL